MNIYVIVEGELGSINLYKSWIKHLNPNLINVDYPYQIQENNYYVLGGLGYPQIKDIIRNKIEEVNKISNIDRFVVAIDSEDASYDEKYEEFNSYLQKIYCSARYYLIIQHFCLETWALANRKVGPHYPHDIELKEFKRIFDVNIKDPEQLPHLSEKELYRSQFAYKYLIKMLNDKYRNVSYSKTNTFELQSRSYFYEIKKRMESTNHIQSFNEFIRTFT